MGLPALMLFLLILALSFHLGRSLTRNKEDLFLRAVGIGGAAATCCYAVICIFGSRAVNLEFTAYFWVYLVCMQVMSDDLKNKGKKPKKRRTNAFEARDMEFAATDVTLDEAKDSQAEVDDQSTESLHPPKRRKRKTERSDLVEARIRRRRLKSRKG